MPDSDMTVRPVPPPHHFAGGVFAVVGGLSAAFAFPDYGLWPAGWVALTPLLVSLRRVTPAAGAMRGFLYGLPFFGLTVPWVFESMVTFGGMGKPLAAGVTLLMVAVLAFYPALFGHLFARIAARIGYAAALFVAPSLWVSVEFLRERVPHIGFPWGRLGEASYAVPTMIQIAEIGGTELLSFLMAAVAAAAAGGIVALPEPEGVRTAARWLVVAVALAAVAPLYGTVRLAQLDAVEPGPTVTVAAVQGDIDQSRKWDVDYRSVQVERYVHLTGWAVDRGARLVVWPETAAPYYFGHEPALDAAMVRLATENDLLLLFGAPAMGREAVSGKPVSYNRAWLVDPAGNATFYDKVRLAPFGEYVPFTDLLFFIRALAAPIGDIHPGEALAPMTGGEWSVGAQICFEAIFPQYSRRLTADGAQVLAIITNDSWFGRTPSSRQALAMGVLRGVENRIPVVRAAQSGVSAIVTAEGRILQATDLFTVAVAMGDIVPRPSGAPLTFYTLTGDLFRWLCVVMALVPFALPRRFGRRP